MPSKSTEERFWEKVSPEPMSGCWLWTASTSMGYGYFRWGKLRTAHSITYEMTHGSIPAGLELDHLCRNRLCCNPDHLEAVTHRANALRGISPNANNARKACCKNGHGFTPENTYCKPGKTHRTCRICNRNYLRLWSSRRAS